MKKTGNENINTKFYWDFIYSTKTYMEDLEKLANKSGRWINDPISQCSIRPSNRFETALGLVKDKERVLDLGCGYGIFAEMVINKYPFNEVWGTDISSKVIERNKTKESGVVYHQQSLGFMDKVPDDYFNLVFAGEILEHLDNPSMLFEDAKRILKVGGRLIVTTPFSFAIQSPEHVWFFEKEDVEKFYTDGGFTKPEFIELPEMEKVQVIFAVGEKK